MKKIVAILLITCMVLSLSACKSKEQKAADQFLEDFKDWRERIDDPAVDQEEEVYELMGELNELLDKRHDVLADLRKRDEKAAEEFEKEFEKLLDDYLMEYDMYAYKEGMLNYGADD